MIFQLTVKGFFFHMLQVGLLRFPAAHVCRDCRAGPLRHGKRPVLGEDRSGPGAAPVGWNLNCYWIPARFWLCESGWTHNRKRAGLLFVVCVCQDPRARETNRFSWELGSVKKKRELHRRIFLPVLHMVFREPSQMRQNF